jgi:hypothetical protein
VSLRAVRAGILSTAAGVCVVGGLAVRRRIAEQDEAAARSLAEAGNLTGSPDSLWASGHRAAPGVRGAARVAPPDWEPPLLRRLARWEPQRPASLAGRLVGYLWAAPLTMAGLLAGAVTGTVPVVADGVLLFAGARGLPRAFLTRQGYSAFALGHVVVTVGSAPAQALLAHEYLHVRQAERLGPAMAPLYLALQVVYGYARNPMERAARRAQRRALGVPEPRAT